MVMDNNDLIKRMDELDRKMDMILDIVNHQKMKTEEVNDLIADITIVGKDIYDSAVEELENQRIELHPEDMRELGIGLLRNIKNFNQALSLFESANDFVKDAQPIVHDVVLDMIQKFNEYDKKGYFDKLSEFGKVVDNAVSHFTVDDIRHLADNIVTLLETVKSLTTPEFQKLINNALKVFETVQGEKIPEYSVFRMMRELNKPEMKRAMGFMVTFMKGMSRE